MKQEPLQESDGPWLIRSHHWGRWHRRSEDGGACGYTDDLSKAGVFGFDMASAYHEPSGGRDEAIPVSRVLAEMDELLRQMQAGCDAFAAKIASIREVVA